MIFMAQMQTQKPKKIKTKHLTLLTTCSMTSSKLPNLWALHTESILRAFESIKKFAIKDVSK